MIRDVHIPINGYLLAQIRILADHYGLDCPETLVEKWLREKLDTMPEIADLVNMRAKHKKMADEEWKAKYPPNQSGPATP